MRTVLALAPLAVAAALLACREAAAQVRSGEEVLVRHEGQYYAATVVSLAGDKVKVKIDLDPVEEAEVALADATAMPRAGEKPKAAKGDWILAKAFGPYWHVSKLEAVSDGDVTIVDPSSGQQEQVRFEAVKVPPEAWRAEIAKEGTRAEELAKIKCERGPLGAGSPVKAGDAAIADRGTGTWYEGTVKAVAGGKVKIQWSGETEEEEVDAARVAPMPPGKKHPVKVGEIVYWKLEILKGWVPARIDRVADELLELTLASGETVVALPGAYVPQQPAK